MQRLLLAFLLFVNLIAFSGNKYWIELDNVSLDSVSSDWQGHDLTIVSQSSLLNAVVLESSQEIRDSLLRLEYVLTFKPVRRVAMESVLDKVGENHYWDFIASLKPSILDSLKLDGRGVRVGIIDAGFTRVDSSAYMKHIVSAGNIVAVKDFVDGEREDFFESKTKGDIHGHNVLNYLGGYDKRTDIQMGLATGAQFWLARTEDGDNENLMEEYHWVEAIEWMIANDVQVVNTSLGYAEFDNEEENHVLSDMNGRTTMITKAAEAAAKKGLLIVVSAGNMGAKKWRYITAPADARHVLTIGATNQKNLSKIYYSSEGVHFVNYLKPNVSCYSNRGTSYSSPSVCGLAACLKQYAPDASADSIMSVLEKSSHLYPYGNTYIGYGVPNTEKALRLIQGDSVPNKAFTYFADKEKVIFKLKEEAENAVLFNKSNESNVLGQVVVSFKDGKGKKRGVKVKRMKSYLWVRLKKMGNEVRSTLQVGDQVIEIIW